MNLIGLITLLETLNLPLAYHHFKDPQTAPFLIYIDTGTESFNADGIVYHSVQNIDIELYCDKRDRSLENKIKDLLNGAEIAYDFSVIYIPANKQFKTTYEVIVDE